MARVPSKKNSIKSEDPDLKRENEELRDRVRELEETLEAIQSGEVDAIVVANGEGRKVYTLEGADHPYRALVENIREGALTLSRTGTILYTNKQFADMVKVPPDKVAGVSLMDFICPEYHPPMELALQEILKQPGRSAVRIHRGKGSLPVYISMNPLTPDENTKISVVVTDRRKDEERLRLQARMLDAVGDAVIAADTHNRIIYWNDAATSTYGWAPEEAIGRDLVEVATPKLSHKEARDIVNRLKKGETWTGEYIVKHRDGHEFPIHANDAPIFDEDGKLIAIIGASHDISERKRTERELAERNEDLNVLNEQLTGAHEDLQEKNTELMAANESLRMTEEELLNANSELIRQQETVTYERDRVREVLDIAGVMIVALDTQGKVTLINPRGCEILRRPEGEIVGRDWVRNFLPVRLQIPMRAVLNRAMSGDLEETRQFENPILTRDNEERHILWSNALLRDDEGKITGMLSSGEDITDRKNAEEALKESEERYRNLVDSSPDGVIVHRNGMFLYANSAALDLYGARSLEELSEKTVLDLIHPDNRSGIRARMRRAMGGGTLPLLETVMLKLDGTPVPVETVGGQVLYEGEPAAQIIIRDITLRKNAEDALRESEERFRGIIENLQDGFIRADTEGKIIMVSPSAAVLYGYDSPEEMIGLSVLPLYIQPEDRVALMKLLNKQKNAIDFESEAVRKDGSTVPVSLNVQYHYDSQGQIRGTQAFVRDITERRAAEARLLVAHNRTNMILESISDSFLTLDRYWRFTYLNRKAVPPGVSHEGMIGRSIWEVFPEIRGTPLERFYHEAMELRTPLVFENQSTVVPGRVFDLHSYPMGDGGIAIFGQDISERKRAEDDLKKKHEDLNAAYEEITSTQEKLRQNIEELTNRGHQLDEALAEKEVLLSEIHHRVKNNLTAFISLLSLEGSYIDTPEGRSLKKDLQNRARSMALIHETLYKTRKFAEVDMHQYLTTLVDQVIASYNSPEHLRIQIDGDGISLDIGHATPMGLIINELLTNSLKYAFPSGMASSRPGEEATCLISVLLTKDDGTYILRVADNGAGLPPAIDIVKTKTLGLKLVNFLARHQLRATIEINTVKGTEFIFRFKEMQE